MIKFFKCLDCGKNFSLVEATEVAFEKKKMCVFCNSNQIKMIRETEKKNNHSERPKPVQDFISMSSELE